jgi:hypothetical protein
MRAKERRHGDVAISGTPPARRWWPWALGFILAGCLVFAAAQLGGGSHPRTKPAILRAGGAPATVMSGLQASRSDALEDYDEPSAPDTAPPQTAWVAEAQQPAVEAFEAPAPAPLATTDGAQAAAEPSIPAVAFLFLTINGEVTWPEVWAAFFAGAADPRMYSVYIHRSSEPGQNKEPSPSALQFLAACRGRAFSVPTAADTAWGQLIAAERSLAAAALNQTENVQFIYQSHTTLPVKSFSDIYETFTARDSSSFCLTTQQTWVRSRLDADSIFPKTAQWISLNRASAERFADVSRGDAVALVNQACGGSWRQCYPATSEELVMAAITGPVPASAMGSDWLASHPPPGGGPDNALVTALLNEAAAEVDDGGAANATLAMAGVNGGGIPVRDVGATNQGVCDTWHWWDDFPSDAEREPAFEPLQLLVDAVKASGGASPETDAETILEQHVDRFWSPPWHPQELRGGGMTEQFLLDGLCASKSLFARKFSAEFTLRPAPVPRNAAGEWDCPADDWKASPHEKLDGVSCDGMRHAPIQGVGLAECRQLCCAMGRDRCTAWQYRGRWSAYHACWLGREAGRCSDYGEAKAQLWRGERLLPEPEPLPQNASAGERQRVVDAFTRCFQRRSTAEVAEPELVIDSAAAAPAPAEAAPMPADVEEAPADAAPLPTDAEPDASGDTAELQAEQESDESSGAEADAEEGSGAEVDESSSSEEQAPQQP